MQYKHVSIKVLTNIITVVAFGFAVFALPDNVSACHNPGSHRDHNFTGTGTFNSFTGPLTGEASMGKSGPAIPGLPQNGSYDHIFINDLASGEYKIETLGQYRDQIDEILIVESSSGDKATLSDANFGGCPEGGTCSVQANVNVCAPNGSISIKPYSEKYGAVCSLKVFEVKVSLLGPPNCSPPLPPPPVAPLPITLGFETGDYCTEATPPIQMTWNFFDPGDTQSAYQVQIDDDGAFGVVTDGLVGYWNMETGHGQDVLDQSGLGNHGTRGDNPIASDAQDPTWVAGKPGNGTALSFDGNGDNVIIPDNDSLDVTTGFAITAWINVDQYQSKSRILTKRFDRWGDPFSFMVDQFDDLAVCVGVTNPELYDVGHCLRSNNVSLDTWHFVAATWDGSIIKLYMDGGPPIAQAAWSGTLDVNNNDLYIGNNQIDNRRFNGMIDEVRLYNRAITQAEYNSLYNVGFGSVNIDSLKEVSSEGFYVPTGGLEYAKTYNWRVRVWDSSDNVSPWVVGPSFQTAPYEWPNPSNFSWDLPAPETGDAIQFSDDDEVPPGNSFDGDPFHNSANPLNVTWAWDFDDGMPVSNAEDPIHTYVAANSYDLQLEACDGMSCCSANKTVDVVPSSGSLTAAIDCVDNISGVPVSPCETWLKVKKGEYSPQLKLVNDSTGSVTLSTWTEMLPTPGTIWAPPCAGKCDHTVQIHPTDSYTVELEVEDGVNLPSTASIGVDIKQDIEADFECSLDGAIPDWLDCETMSIVAGTDIYFRAVNGLNLSVPSQGAAIDVWNWDFEIAGTATPSFLNCAGFAPNTCSNTFDFYPVTFTSIGEHKVQLCISDTQVPPRSDCTVKTFSVRTPFFKWKEISPF